MALSCCKKSISNSERNNIKNNGGFYCWIVFILLEQKTNLNCIKMYVKIIFFVMYLCVLRTLLKYYNLIKIRNLIKHHLLIANDLWQVLYQILLKIYLKEFIERLMDVKIILKIHSQQNYANIFHQVIQCLQYYRLKSWKISMMYIEVKIVWKSSVNS